MSAKAQLENIIRNGQLDFRSDFWKETLFMIQQNIYSETQCQMLIPDAMDFAEETEDKGIFLWRPPIGDELTADGKPDIEVGRLVEANERFGARFIDRPRNCFCCGSSGSGKTVFGLNMCVKIDATNKYQKVPTSLIIWDMKPDYLTLKNQLVLPVEIYSPVHGLRIGLNCPENTVPYLWITEISLTLAARLGLISSRTLLTKIIIALLLILNPGLAKEDLGKADVAKDLTWPSLELVLKAVKNKTITGKFSGKESYSQTLWHALEGLILDAGKLFDCSVGLDINREILSEEAKHCIFDVSNNAPHVVHIISDIILYQIMMKRMAGNYKTDHTDMVMLYEESDLLLESDIKNFPSGLSPLEKLHRLGRELGIMSIVNVSGL